MVVSKTIALDVLNQSEGMLEKLRGIIEGTDDIMVFWDFCTEPLPSLSQNVGTTPIFIRAEIRSYSVPNGPNKVSIVFSERTANHVRQQVYLSLSEFTQLVEKKPDILKALMAVPATSI